MSLQSLIVYSLSVVFDLNSTLKWFAGVLAKSPLEK